jgi:hypothetical protein
MRRPYRQSLRAKFSEKTKPLVSILVMVIVIVSLYVSSYIPFNQYLSKQIEAFNAIESGSGHQYYGYIQPQVVDGFSEEPIEGAAVVIPEISQRFETAKDGYTAMIRVPIEEDQHFEDIAPKPWGEITIIVYKDGYIEYVLFNTHVWESQTRKGPKIMLFPEVEGDKNEPFTVVEGPHRIWVKELVDKFRP